MHRSVLKNAPYNPRQIDEFAKKRLRDALKEDGLLEALSWNKRSGNLISGHQRLASLDALEGHGNYLLDMCVVDLSPAKEKEANVRLNNPSLQGTWDLLALAEVLKDPEVKLEATGFEPMDLQVIFDDTELATMFAPDQQPDAVNEAVDELAAVQAAGNEANKTKRMAEAEIAKIIAQRKAKQKQYDGEEQTENFVIVMFVNDDDRKKCLQALKYAESERYVDGQRLLVKFGLAEG